MSGIPLQPGIIYGPILSRRLGRSLGINLSGAHRKVCSFDCVYCQYGAEAVIDTNSTYVGWPSVEEVLAAVEKAIKKPRTIDYLTFSGNGEPTLHPDFAEIVSGVLSLRNQFRPDTKLAILSNSSRVTDPDIVLALQLLDSPMMKLDAGDELTFLAINRPAKGIHFGELVNGLKEIPNLMIQSLLIDGEVSNVSGDAYEAWAETLAELCPSETHIYSIERPTPSNRLLAVNPRKLQEISVDISTRFNLSAHPFW